MQTRPLISSDYDRISPVIDQWWGGRPVAHLLPRLFFRHFSNTSFAIDGEDGIQGFLVGFRSQSDPLLAYIHFVGVGPRCRGRGLGRLLYLQFFDAVKAMGCTQVECITSPVNSGSVHFHRAMGFELVDGGLEQNGFPVVVDEAGPGQHRVKFRRHLA
jgi:hypothetical protein